MAEVLTPRLHSFGGTTDLLAKLIQRFPKGVRIEYGRPVPGERLLEDLADRSSIRPMAPIEAVGLEFAVGTQASKACRKQRVIKAK